MNRPRIPSCSWAGKPVLLLGEEPVGVGGRRHRVVGRGEGDLVQRAGRRAPRRRCSRPCRSSPGASLIPPVVMKSAPADQDHARRRPRSRSAPAGPGRGPTPPRPPARGGSSASAPRRRRRRRRGRPAITTRSTNSSRRTTIRIPISEQRQGPEQAPDAALGNSGDQLGRAAQRRADVDRAQQRRGGGGDHRPARGEQIERLGQVAEERAPDRLGRVACSPARRPG